MAAVTVHCSVAKRGSPRLMEGFLGAGKVLPEMQEKSPRTSVKQSKPKHFQVSNKKTCEGDCL